LVEMSSPTSLKIFVWAWRGLVQIRVRKARTVLCMAGLMSCKIKKIA
jgi:hypothetical protein